MDGGAWWATVHGVAKSQTGLSDFTFTFHFHALEKEMATSGCRFPSLPRFPLLFTLLLTSTLLSRLSLLRDGPARGLLHTVTELCPSSFNHTGN